MLLKKLRKLQKGRDVKVKIATGRRASFLHPAPVQSSKKKSSPEELMAEVNKYIFVQEFERASTLLARLSFQHDENCEIHFRRIEVASRSEDLEKVATEYETRRKQRPENAALAFAATLAEIRVLDKKSHTLEFESELVNPSFDDHSRGVVGLSIASEDNFGGSATHLRTSSRHIMMREGTNGSIKMRGKTLHIERVPVVADDAVPLDVSMQPDTYVDDVAKPLPSVTEDIQKYPVLGRALDLKRLHPNNYAAWYVAGCAYEFAGELNSAIESWNRSIELEPKAISVLATMAELQQIGALASDSDYAARFEALDKNLVHGAYETHTELHKEFLAKGEYRLAIAALRTLADWIQRQRGDVPAEVEILCLLGAMRAYSLEGNASASEACRREVERLVISCKKSPRNSSQLTFIAQICEEYNLKNLAKILYFSVLTSPDSPADLVVRIAAHTVTNSASPALKECLKSAYRNTHGHPEVRFCQLLCTLFVANVPVEKYMRRKAEIRELFEKNDLGQAFPLLNESLKDTEEDAEVQFYMGDLLTRLGMAERARGHFEAMYDLDSMNPESVMRYVTFLLRQRDYQYLKEVCKRAMDIPSLTAGQRADLFWARAFAYAESEDFVLARSDIENAIKFSPWNKHYLSMQLSIIEREENGSTLPNAGAVQRFYEIVEKDVKDVSEEFIKDWVVRLDAAIQSGSTEYAFIMGKIALLLKPRSSTSRQAYVRAGAAYDSRLAVQQLLQILNVSQENAPAFSDLALMSGHIYSLTGEWPLVQEWIDIAERSGVDGKLQRAKVFELQALAYAMKGVHLKKAQNLVEAAFDAYDGQEPAPHHLGALLAYLQVAQGDPRQATEKLQAYMEQPESILVLYFVIKGLERMGKLVKTYRGADPLKDFFKLTPTNPLELKLIEEIYCLLGIQNEGQTIHLAS